MQSNALNIAAGKSVSMPCTGRGIWFESGTSTTTNQYIIVKPDNGGSEFRIKPGQSVKGLTTAASWTITAEDAAAVIAGKVIIGDGDFNDNNTSNLVTIDASAVTNTLALPVKKQALATITHFAPVTITTGVAQALVSDATQRRLQITNTHATATLYVGGPLVTAANAAWIIGPGDTWTEEDAAGAALYATSDTVATVVNLMGLKL